MKHTRKKKSKKHIKNKHHTKNKQGGKVIACGGYGCVFNPALKCKESNQSKEGKKRGKRDKNKITKLMIHKYATREFEEINSIKKILDKIPNYEKYYLLDNITMCKPAKLTKKDLQSFTKKCKALPKHNITKSNINSKLDQLTALNIPNGGVPVDDFLYTDGNYRKLYNTHTSMVQLLKNGIIPMNKHHVYHSDIKDSNILIQETNTKLTTRLIDWGLTVKYSPKTKQSFPRYWRNRPFQFNTPFSIILFTDLFYEKYTKYLKNGGEPEEGQLKPFIINYIHEWMKKRGAGHYKFINEIMFLLFQNSFTHISKEERANIIETEITFSYMVDYIVNILVHYTHFTEDGTLNLREYLDNVFVKNIDVWGFISAYYPFLEIFGQHYNDLEKTEKKAFEQLQLLYTKYLFTESDKAVNLDNLYDDLDIFGELLLNIEMINGNTNTHEITTKRNSSSRFIKIPKTYHFQNPLLLPSH